MTVHDDDALLQAIRAGDLAAFGRWAARAEPSLRASLRPFAAQVDTEAVLQEALLRVWQVAPRFTPDDRPNALLRFASITARNCAVSELRKVKATPQELSDLERALGDEPQVRPSAPDPFLRDAIADCREKLPSKPAAALTQRLESQGAVDDAVLAERLGMRLNTFLQNFTRARKLLQDCLQKRGVDLAAELSP